MAADGTAPRPDDDEGSDAPEFDPILLAVEQCKARAWSTGRIVAMLTDKSGPFGVSERTAYRRIAQSAKEWARVGEQARPVFKAQCAQYLHEIIAAAHECEPKQLGAAATAVKQLSALYGLDEPAEFRDRTEKVVDLSKLTDDELATHVRLMRKASGEPASEE